MKQYSILGLAAISISFLFVGCDRLEPIAPVGGDETPTGEARVEMVTARLEGGDQGTKVSADLSTGKISWMAGDQVAYCISNGVNTTYQIGTLSAENAADATIPLSMPEGYYRANYAIYPASAAPASPASEDYRTPTVVYPASYDLADFADGYIPTPMVAVNGRGDLNFYHVGGLLRLKVSDIPSGTTSLAVIFTGMFVTGRFSVSNAGTAAASCSLLSEGGCTVTFTNGGNSFDSSVMLVIPVPTGNSLERITIRYKADATVQSHLRKTVRWNSFARAQGRIAEIDESNSEELPKFIFTVSADGKTVEFAPGNLQATIGGPGAVANIYVASSWNFAEHQWSYLGSTNGANSFATGTKVDLFSWVGEGVTDAYDSYGLCTLNTNNATYFGNQTTGTLKTDWGAIPEVVSTLGAGWYTMSADEWTYLCDTRSQTRRFVRAMIRTDASSDANIRGVILFPDDFPAEESFDGVTFRDMNGKGSYGSANSDWTVTKCTSCTVAGWEALEAAGCVFLPASGYRLGTSSGDIGTRGSYLTTTPHSAVSSDAFRFNFGSSICDITTFTRYNGYSVRLAREL